MGIPNAPTKSYLKKKKNNSKRKAFMLYKVFLESVGCRKGSKGRYFDTDSLVRFQVILDIFLFGQ